jgi:hypothetical protein
MTCIYLCSRYLVMLPILAFVEDVIEYKRLISDLYQLGCLIASSNIFLLEICCLLRYAWFMVLCYRVTSTFFMVPIFLQE